MSFEFVDFVTKAKQLGVTEATLRAKILSHYEDLPCFMYVSHARAFGSQEEFLPAWSEEEFPFVHWEDHGCEWEGRGLSEPDISDRRRPRYSISGWTAISQHAFSEIFMRGHIVADANYVWAVSGDFAKIFPVQIQVKAGTEWVESGGYEEGGYLREVPPLVTRNDLYWISNAEKEGKLSSARKDKSYLGIISAMRALLMDKDGGNFPSQAKVIDELERRYSEVTGVSKRNLEKVFADATQTIGSDLKQKP